jgi:cytidyltransferase-like protein
METIIVTGSFDDLRSQHIRFLQEAARLGEVHALVWSDEAVAAATGQAPRFPQAERLYLLESIRYVKQAALTDANVYAQAAALNPAAWAVYTADDKTGDATGIARFCQTHRIAYRALGVADVAGFPTTRITPTPGGAPRKKVVVTGCYDWFHSGHVRFFEEVSALGDLYVVVGHDANVRLLKGAGHPMFPEAERRYVVQSIRYVTQALVSSGNGWMDAEPEIAALRPDIYAVNEDGDKPEKRAFCADHGLEYVVLKRKPKPGLPRRASSTLRGF